MSDTQFSKPSHTNGPSVKIFDLVGTTSYPHGPYAEAVVPLGWDPVGLQFVKIKVTSDGTVYTTGGGGTGGGGGIQYPEGTVVATATGNLILGKDGTAQLNTPTVRILANATPMAVMIVDSTGGQITSFGTSTTTVVQGTATNLNATVVGTVTNVPSGTQTVKSDGGNFIVTQATGTNLHIVV